MDKRDENGRFVKGHTKIGGRELGTRDFAVDFNEVIEEYAEEHNITPLEARKILVKIGFVKSKQGNFPFYKDTMDRYYGKAPDTLDVSENAKDILSNIFAYRAKSYDEQNKDREG